MSAPEERNRFGWGSLVRVVALTSSTMKGDRERFLADGFDGYLEKPIRVREFPSQIRGYLA